MPLVSLPAKVLVTGASGFIAAQVCRTLLEKGYSVVGTGAHRSRRHFCSGAHAILSVRSESKGDYLKDLFKDFEDKFSYVIVKDIDKVGQ